jgi:hypothetical protein
MKIEPKRRFFCCGAWLDALGALIGSRGAWFDSFGALIGSRGACFESFGAPIESLGTCFDARNGRIGLRGMRGDPKSAIRVESASNPMNSQAIVAMGRRS